MISLYLIKNKLNCKIYVGQTKKSPSRRLMEHKSCARNKKHNCYKLENAINKYGEGNFFVEEIATTKNQDDANELEIFFIKEYDSITNGYNLQSGGQGNRDISGAKNPRAKLTEKEMKEIFYLASNKVKTQTEIAKQFSVNRTTIQRILYNDTWTSEKRRRINVQRKLQPEQIRQIKKLILDGNLSKTNIAKIFHVSKSMIGHICKGRIYSEINLVG